MNYKTIYTGKATDVDGGVNDLNIVPDG